MLPFGVVASALPAAAMSDPHEDTIRVRVAVLETEVRDTRRALADLQGTLGKWTVALVIFMLGAAVTVAGALVGYGRLQERADQTAAALESVQDTLEEIRRDARAH